MRGGSSAAIDIGILNTRYFMNLTYGWLVTYMVRTDGMSGTSAGSSAGCLPLWTLNCFFSSILQHMVAIEIAIKAA